MILSLGNEDCLGLCLCSRLGQTQTEEGVDYLVKLRDQLFSEVIHVRSNNNKGTLTLRSPRQIVGREVAATIDY